MNERYIWIYSYWLYRIKYLLEVRDKSRAGPRSDVKGNRGYRRKFGFEEENAYKGRMWPYRPDFVCALKEVEYTETAHLKEVC